MSRKKGHHYFEKGNLVIPHPLVYMLWSEIGDNEIGLVLDADVKPIKESFKLLFDVHKATRIYWISSGTTSTLPAYAIYHQHQTDLVNNIKQKIAEYTNNIPDYAKIPVNSAVILLKYNHSKYQDFFNEFSFPRINPLKDFSEY
mgnify:CR=1 FL=1|tara:strand:- start:105 stop:536 length:432 start_codon:yes stop_codon:yes gene_type:complete